MKSTVFVLCGDRGTYVTSANGIEEAVKNCEKHDPENAVNLILLYYIEKESKPFMTSYLH